MDNQGNIFFINNNTNQDYEILLPAEIGSFTCRTKLQATNSHWLGRQTEGTKLHQRQYSGQMPTSLHYGTTSPETHHQLLTFIVKDCLSRTTSDNTDPDVIIVHTQRLYDIPRDQCEPKKNIGKASRMHKIVLDPIPSTSTSQKAAMKEDTKMSEETANMKTHTANFVKAHLSSSQPLCTAMYKKNLDKNRGRTRPSQTWQLVTKSIKVIDHSNKIIEPRYQAILPTAEKQGTGPSAALADFKIEKKICSK
ncbi:hypothetical protein BDR05DRAFT_951913 [Suillus weaverae]|nr:hypothetical protein BDR05DRAFT_951913 [Suillus weaverae]